MLSYQSVLSKGQKQSKRPNIIWLMAEDIAPDLACYGTKAVKTPNLDALAAKGTRFTKCYATNSICSPSRSAMMIGTHQLAINAGNHRSNRDIPLDKDFKPFTYYLREAGYTCILGHSKVMDKGTKIDCNFKHTAIGPWDGVDNFGLFDKKFEFSKADEPFFSQIQLKVTHRGDWWNDVRKQSEYPVNLNDVELPPYIADTPETRLDYAKYLDMIEYADNEVGMLIQELKEKGLYDNTIIIFIGDNGRCNIRGKGYLFDSGLHIPLIISGNKFFDQSIVNENLVCATDITATILDLAGIEKPKNVSGKSLLQNNFKRTYVFGARDTWDEIHDQSRCLIGRNYYYVRHDKPEIPFDAHQGYLEFYRPAVHIMRQLNEQNKLNAAQKYFFEEEKMAEEFYSMKNDPYQINNLIHKSGSQDKIEKYKSKLLELEEKFAPKDDVVHHTTPQSVKILEWLKNEHPEVIERMKAGEEVGLSYWKEEFDKAHGITKKKKKKNE
ncbi:sulfatase [Labilibacter sediminis]|nr:sulfatase [Labilibacter sediminis]